MRHVLPLILGCWALAARAASVEEVTIPSPAMRRDVPLFFRESCNAEPGRLTVVGADMDMIRVQPGIFTMGAAADDGNPRPDRTPSGSMPAVPAPRMATTGISTRSRGTRTTRRAARIPSG